MLNDIFNLAVDVADGLSSPLYAFGANSIVPDENTRAAILREAMRWEFMCGAAGKVDDLTEARRLVRFIGTAPMGIDLSFGIEVADDGSALVLENVA